MFRPPDTNGFVGPEPFRSDRQRRHRDVEQERHGRRGVEGGERAVVPATRARTAAARARRATTAIPSSSTIRSRTVGSSRSSRCPIRTSNAGPSFQCVAVSKTADPTGAVLALRFQIRRRGERLRQVRRLARRVLRDVQFVRDVGVPRRRALRLRPRQDARRPGGDAAVLLEGVPDARPRVRRRKPSPSTRSLPANLDGEILPPPARRGSSCSSIRASARLRTTSSISGRRTSIGRRRRTALSPDRRRSRSTDSLRRAAPTPNCIPQPGTTSTLDSLADKSMFRFNYRNFGTYQSLLVNHSFVAAATGGVRWYEIRYSGRRAGDLPTGNVRAGRRAVALDGQHRAGSGAGFCARLRPVGDDAEAGRWLDRPPAADTVGHDGTGRVDARYRARRGVDDYGTGRTRFGDYSNMSVDPTDDCTFWYRRTRSRRRRRSGWDTYVASTKFANCGANDFHSP